VCFRLRQHEDYAGERRRTTKNVGTIKVYMKDRSQRDAVNRPWLEMFPDENDRPARHAIEYDAFPPGVLVQLEIVAVVD